MLLKNARIIDPAGPKRLIENGCIAISGGTIEAVGAVEAVETVGAGELSAADFDTTIDLDGKTVLPGMINAHTHLYSALALGMPPPVKKPGSFVEILENIWWKLDWELDEKSNLASFEAGLIACLGAGVTTVIDHHSSQNCIDGSLDMLAETAARFGIDISPSFEVTDRNGSDAFKTGLDENLRALEKYNSDSHVKPLMGLHASFTLSDQSLQIIRDRIQGKAIGIHIHTAEDKFDQLDAVNRGYRLVIDRLDKFDLLNGRSLVIHGLFIDEEDIIILMDKGVSLIHCPASNANNRVGNMKSSTTSAMRAGLGTDGMQTNMLKEAKEGSLIASSSRASAEVNIDYSNLLFNNNSAIAGKIFGRKTGRIEKGCQADLAIYDYRNRTALTEDNITGHLIFGLTGPVDIMTRGVFRIKDGEFTDIDERKILTDARNQSAKLWKKIQEM